METPRAPTRRPDVAAGRVAALTILAHPDPVWVGGRVLLRDLGAGRVAEVSRLAPCFLLPNGDARPLADAYLSRQPWRLEPRSESRLRLIPGALELEVDGRSPGRALDLEPGALERGVVIRLGERVALLLHAYPAVPHSALAALGLVGRSAALDLVRQEILRAATSEVPVLVRGETGTGKELVARAIHEHGSRRGGPWVVVNMAAIPVHLAAAEFFGVERGAFTGATSRRGGFFQQAQGGTLFLDEIGETPAEVQTLLLRALESGEVQRVGAAASSRVDVRIISATDADLEAKVSNGEFRAPLLHRLAGFEITLPPLRNRRDDLGLLLYHFLVEELRTVGDAARMGPRQHGEEPWIGASLVTGLAAYDWPGNVRELRNVARRLVAANPGPEPARLPATLLRSETMLPQAETVAGFAIHRRKPSEITDAEIMAALEAHSWDRKATARSLGMARSSLYLRLESMTGVKKAAELSRREIEDTLRGHGRNLPAAAAELRVSVAGLEQRMRKLGCDAPVTVDRASSSRDLED